MFVYVCVCVCACVSAPFESIVRNPAESMTVTEKVG